MIKSLIKMWVQAEREAHQQVNHEEQREHDLANLGVDYLHLTIHPIAGGHVVRVHEDNRNRGDKTYASFVPQDGDLLQEIAALLTRQKMAKP